MNKAVIALLLAIGIFAYFAIVASLVSVKLNPENPAIKNAYGQSEAEPFSLPNEGEKANYPNSEEITRILLSADNEILVEKTCRLLSGSVNIEASDAVAETYDLCLMLVNNVVEKVENNTRYVEEALANQ